MKACILKGFGVPVTLMQHIMLINLASEEHHDLKYWGSKLLVIRCSKIAN